jgi:hypothetical protein
MGCTDPGEVRKARVTSGEPPRLRLSSAAMV